MKPTFNQIAFTALALVAGSVSLGAQSPSTGAFSGKVHDSAGNPVPGARVILTGPALQGSRTVVTGADGSYRISLVPVGRGYRLQVTAPLGNSQVKDIALDPWQSYPLNFVIHKAAEATATVEVIAANSSVVVDTGTVTEARTLNTEDLQTLPVFGRDFSDTLSLAPGVTGSGRGAANPNISGGTAFENNYLVDGLNITDPHYGENRTRINTLAIESVQVQTGGYEPEYGRSTGGIVSVLTKTGSNDFTGDFEVTFRPKSTIAKATAQEDLAFNQARTEQGNESELSFWTGGPLVKDKLWYSLGITSSDEDSKQSYGPVYFLDPSQAVNNPLAGPAKVAGLSNNGTSYDLRNQHLDLTGKLTWSLNTDNTLELALTRNREKDQNSLLGLTFSENASTVTSHPQDVDIATLNWRSSITSNWLIDARFGTYHLKSYDDVTPQYDRTFVSTAIPAYVLAGDLLGGTTTPTPVFPDYPARAYPGLQQGGWGSADSEDIKRKQFNLKSTHFLGDHTLKYGVDFEENQFGSFSRRTGDFSTSRTINVDPITGKFISFTDTYSFRLGANGTPVDTGLTQDKVGPDGKVVLDENGDPVQVAVIKPVLVKGAGLDLHSKNRNLALFIQDSWQATPKLHVLYGLRADSQAIYGGDGQKYIDFKFKDMTAPRLGLTFDPNGDGKSKYSASFGRYYESIPMDLNQRAGSVEGFVYFKRKVTDESQLFQVPTLSDLLDANNQRMPGVSGYRVIGGQKTEVDPAIKPQSVEEIALGYERQFTPAWKAAAKWKYRYLKSFIEDFSFDFGSHYVLGNPGQRGLGTKPAQVQDYDYPGQDVTLDFPKPVRDYRELVLSMDKAKGGDSWSFSAALTFATNTGNVAGLDSPLNGQADPNISSTYDLPTLMRNTYGPLPNTPRYNFQATGSYDLGLGFEAGLRFLYRAGTAISALGPDLGALTHQTDGNGDPIPGTYYAYNGQFLHDGNYGNSEALQEPRGSRGTTPDVARFDLHLSWTSASLGSRQAKISAFLDIYNLFNEQTVLTVNQNKQYQYLVTGAPATANGTLTGPNDPNTTGYIALDNPGFLRPTSFQAPRSLQLGVRLSF
jgi:hypothetical protein